MVAYGVATVLLKVHPAQYDCCLTSFVKVSAVTVSRVTAVTELDVGLP